MSEVADGGAVTDGVGVGDGDTGADGATVGDLVGDDVGDAVGADVGDVIGASVIAGVGAAVISPHWEHPVQSPQVHFKLHSFLFFEQKPLHVPVGGVGSGVSSVSSSSSVCFVVGAGVANVGFAVGDGVGFEVGNAVGEAIGAGLGSGPGGPTTEHSTLSSQSQYLSTGLKRWPGAQNCIGSAPFQQL